MVSFYGRLSRALSSGAGVSQAPSRLSGLQLDVLKLYRALLRVARTKDKKIAVRNGTDNLVTSSLNNLNSRYSYLSNSADHSIYSKGEKTKWHHSVAECNNNRHDDTVRSEFRDRSMSVSRSDFETIEHMVRQGYKQKKLLEMPGFSGFQVVRRMDGRALQLIC
jgi:hypothetical protein